MKREVVLGDGSASIEVDGGQLVYRRNEQGLLERGNPQESRRSYSLVELTPGCFSVVLDGRVFRVNLAPSGATVNGRAMDMELVDPRDLRAGSRGQAKAGRQNLVAPMPGKVIHVLISVGDRVEAGQGLVVVEAMKMQNEIKSPKAGVVVEIRTKADAVVGAGDVLLVVE